VPRTEPGFLSVRQLLSVPALAEVTLVGGEAGLDRRLDAIELVSATSDLAALRERSLVLAAMRARPTFELELVVRQASDHGAAGVLLVNANRSLMTTSRLADRLKLPTLLVQASDPVHLAWRLSELLANPAQRSMELLNTGLALLSSAASTPGDIVTALAKALDGRAALIASDGTRIAGSELLVELSALAPSAVQTVTSGGMTLAVSPVFVDDPRRADLWVAAELRTDHPDWAAASRQIVAAAAGKLGIWALRQRLTGERNERERTDVLAELLESVELGPTLVERALRAGLRLDGWHTACYIRSAGTGELSVRLARQVEQALGAVARIVPFVERTDGWVTWLTSRSEPATASYRQLTTSVRDVVNGLAGSVDVRIGIGRPYEGPRGVERSIREARDAVLFAQPGGGRGPVQHADELGVRRVLSEWYRAEGFRSYAGNMLAPLLAVGEPGLLETLGFYLDRESSASATAAALGIHRNTVAHRIARAEQLLNVNLSRADDRLVVQLACRVLGLGGDITED
jgi:purine catabolism regulator